MKTPISDIAFTPAVKFQQERFGSREAYAGLEEKGGWKDRISQDLNPDIARASQKIQETARSGSFTRFGAGRRAI